MGLRRFCAVTFQLHSIIKKKKKWQEVIKNIWSSWQLCYIDFFFFVESEETEEELKDSRSNSSLGDEETASLANVDSYIELLYEEIPEKVRASGLVLQLARDTGNLNVLRKNGR